MPVHMGLRFPPKRGAVVRVVCKCCWTEANSLACSLCFVYALLLCFSFLVCVYSIAIGSIFVCKCICVFLFVFTLLCANIAIIRGLVEACGLFYAHSSSTLFFSLPLPSNGRIVLVQSSFGEFNSTHLQPKAAGFVATTRGKRDFENA